MFVIATEEELGNYQLTFYAEYSMPTLLYRLLQFEKILFKWAFFFRSHLLIVCSGAGVCGKGKSSEGAMSRGHGTNLCIVSLVLCNAAQPFYCRFSSVSLCSF